MGAVVSPQASRAAAVRILERLDARAFAGADPYDALNARRLPAFAMSTKRGRQLVTQVVKRSPFELRGVLGVPAGVSPYTLGHVLSACSRLAPHGALPSAHEVAGRASALLGDLALAGFSGTCWGYHFDVQTRFFFYAKTTPNVIATAFAAKGLAEATACGLVDGRKAVLGACEFILRDLPRVRDDVGQSFGYIPTSDTIVHNANMLAALVLTLGAQLGGDDRLLGEAIAAARFTVAHQRADGSWPYSEQADGRWVDGFHTGFVLEGLHAVATASGDTQLQDALGRGLAYYLERLFDPDGAPRYYDTRALPYDALSAAQGIEALGLFAGHDERSRAVRGLLTQWTLRRLLADDGRVAYRITKRGTDWREYPRWSSAPMCAALASDAED